MILPTGNRGSWCAIVDGARIPCVHEYWKNGMRYEDPGCMPGVGKWPNFIKAIQENQVVLLTRSKVSDAPQRKSGKSMARSAYLSVWEVRNVEADERSLRFEFSNLLHSFE